MTVSPFRLAGAARSTAPFLELPAPEEARRIRLEACLTLKQIAKAVGVTSMAVSRWERGVATPCNYLLAGRYSRVLQLLESEAAHAATREVISKAS